MTIRIFLLLLFVPSQTFGFLPSQKQLNISKIKEATLRVEVWRRPIRKDNGRRKFAAPDKLISRGAAVVLGKGYILTAYHIMKEIVEETPHHYVRIFTSKGDRVKGLAVSRCEKLKGDKRPDLCLLKGNLKNHNGVELPKDILNEPSKDSVYALINQNENLGKIGELQKGKFKKIVKVDPNGEFDANKGIKLFRTNIKTAKANSGSIVFDIESGRILGLTTNGIKLKQKKTDGSIKKWMEAEVIPSHTIRKYLNTPGWKSKPLPPHQVGFID